MHQDVVTQLKSGATEEQVVQSFFDRYGASVLMAPPAHGLNLAAYLLPGAAVIAAAAAVLFWLSRREPAPAVAAAPTPAPLDAADVERLRRALDQVDS